VTKPLWSAATPNSMHRGLAHHQLSGRPGTGPALAHPAVATWAPLRQSTREALFLCRQKSGSAPAIQLDRQVFLMARLRGLAIQLRRCTPLPRHWLRRTTTIPSRNPSTQQSWWPATILPLPILQPTCDRITAQPLHPITVTYRRDNTSPPPALLLATLYRKLIEHGGLLHAQPVSFPSLIKETGSVMKAPSVSYKHFGSVCLVAPQQPQRVDTSATFAMY